MEGREGESRLGVSRTRRVEKSLIWDQRRKEEARGRGCAVKTQWICEISHWLVEKKREKEQERIRKKERNKVFLKEERGFGS